MRIPSVVLLAILSIAIPLLPPPPAHASPTPAQADERAALERATAGAAGDAAAGEETADGADREDEADPTSAAAKRRRIQEKYRAILERNPYHDVALSKTLQMAAEENTLDALVEEFQALARENPVDPGYRFILARIYQKGDRLVEAVAELQAVPEPHDRVLGLLGEIQIQRGELDDAAVALERAAGIAQSEKSLRRLYRSIGTLHLARGDREKAAAALRRIIEIDPGSYYLRKEVAEALAEAELYEEALADYQALLDLSETDASKKCGVLRQMGQIHERRKDPAKALEVYRTAADLMRRGNWMKADLEARIIQVHRTQGTLDELRRSVRARIETSPKDVDPRLFLARVEEEMGDAEGAVETLRGASEIFPEDLDLGKRLIAALGELGRPDEQVAEYQRLIAAHPKETDLYLELGRIFARDDKFAQAKLQWEQVIARDIQDPNLCLRLAELYGQYELVDDAIRSYELAIELAPKEKSHHVSFGDYLFSIGRKEEAVERWMQIRGLDDEAEVTLAEILFGHQMDEEALEIALAAREAGTRTAPLFLLLSEIHRAIGDIPSAYAAAREAADIAETDATREEAVVALVSLHESEGTLDALLEREEAVVTAEPGPKSLVSTLILGEIFVRTRQTSRAVETYRKIVEGDPGQVDVVERLADLYNDAGDSDAAIETYERVIALRPGKERPIYKKIAQIHLQREDRERAFQTWRKMIRSQPDNPGVYEEVADEYKRLGLVDEAIEHYRQAIERGPADPVEVRIQLAEVLTTKKDEDGAIAQLEEALKEAKGWRERRRVRKRIYELHQQRGTLETAIRDLEEGIDENPYDVESAKLLAYFHLRGYEYALAIEMLDRVIPFQRGEASLLFVKAKLLLEMEEHERAVEVYEAASKIKGVDRDEIFEAMGAALIDMGDRPRAAEAFAQIRDKTKEAQLLQKHEMPEVALRRYEALLVKDPDHPEHLLEKARILRDMGKREEAADVYQRVLELKPSERDALTELGAVWMDLKRRDKAVEAGRRLLGSVEDEERRKKKEKEEDDEEERLRYNYRWGYWYSGSGSFRRRSKMKVARDYFQEHGLLQEWAEVLEEEVAETPENIEARLALAAVYEGELSEPEKALDAYRAMLPFDWDEDEFTQAKRSQGSYTSRQGYRQALDPQEEIWKSILGVYGKRADLRQKRLDALRDATDLSADEVLELSALYSQSGMQDEGREALVSGAARHAGDPRFLALLAQRDAGDERWEDAIRHNRALLEAVRGSGGGMTEKEEKRRRISIRNSIPYYIRDNATKAQVEEVVDLVVAAEERGQRRSLWVPSDRSILGSIARAAFRLERDDEAKAALDGVLALGDDFLNRAHVGDIYFLHEKYDEAEALYVLAKEGSTRRQENPVHEWYYRDSPNALPASSARNLGTIYQKKGEFVRAYEVFREGNFTSEARRVVKEGKLEDVLRERFTRERDEARAALEGLEGDPLDDALKRYVEISIQLAELLDENDDHEAAVEVYREAAGPSPADTALTLLEAAAAILERERMLAEAIELQQEQIRLKKEAIQEIRTYREKKTISVYPRKAYVSGGTFRYSRRTYGRGSTQQGFATRFDTRENYFGLAELYVKKGEPEAAVRALIKWVRENPGQQNYYTWEIQEFARNQKLDGEILPLLRLFGMENAKYPWQRIQYAAALEKAEEWEDAIRQYERVLSDFASAQNDFYILQAEQKLQALYEKAGLKEKVLADLQAEIEQNPRNIKKRLKLARLYETMERHEDAAAHVEILVEQAPYMQEVHGLARRLHLRLGNRPAAMQALKKEIELMKGPAERAGLQYVLGNLHEMAGQPDEAKAAWLEMVVPQDANSYITLGGYLLEMQMDEEAAGIFEEGIEAGAKYNWLGSEILRQAARLALHRGDVKRAMELLDEMKDTDATFVYGLAGSNLEASEFLRMTLEPSKFVLAFQALVAQEPDVVENHILLSAAYQANFEYEEGVTALEQALERRPHDQRLLRMVLDRFETMGDVDRAIAYAERWLESLPSDRQSYTSSGRSSSVVMGRSSSTPSGGKKDAYPVLAGLYRWKGEPEKAKEQIRQLEDRAQPSSYFGMAQVFSQNEYHEEALAAYETYMEKTPTRTSSILQGYASHLQGVGRLGDALETLGEALDLSTDDWEQRQIFSSMREIYRKQKDDDTIFAELEQKLEEDPQSLPILLFLGEAYHARGDVERAVELYRRAKRANPSDVQAYTNLIGLYGQERMEEAWLAAIGELIAAFPDQKRQYASTLAEIRFDRGEIEEAVQAWKDSQYDESYYWSHSNLGYTFLRYELYEQAVEEFRQAFAIAPQRSERDRIQAQIADALIRLGDYSAAYEEYRKAFAVNQSPEALAGQAPIYRFLLARPEVAPRIEAIRAKPADELTSDEAADLALWHLFAGDPAEAADIFAARRSIPEEEPLALRGLHLASMLVGDLEAALGALRGWMALEERDEGIVEGLLWTIGDLEMRLGRKDEAIDAWRRAKRVGEYPLYENQARYYYGYGGGSDPLVDRLIRHGLHDDALSEIERRLALGRLQGRDALRLAGENARKGGDDEAALARDLEASLFHGGPIGTVRRAMRDPATRKEVLDYFEDHRRVRPFDTRILNLFAQLHDVVDDREGALAVYREAAERKPHDRDLRTALAYRLVRAGHLDEALPIIEKLAEGGAVDTSSSRYVSSSYVSGGTVYSSRSYNPGYGYGGYEDPKRLLLVTHLALGDAEEVSEIEDELLRGYRGRHHGLFAELASTLKGLDRHEEALSYIRRALAKLPEEVVRERDRLETRRNYLRTELELLSELGRPDEAASRAGDSIALLEKDLEKTPWNGATESSLAEIYRTSVRDLDAALGWIDRAVEASPWSPRFRTSRAWIRLDRGDLDAAATDLAEARRLRELWGGETDDVTLLAEALLAHRRGNPEAAREKLARAERLRGDTFVDFRNDQYREEIDAIASRP